MPPRGSLAGSDQPSGRRSGPAVLHVPVLGGTQGWAGHKQPSLSLAPGRDAAGRTTPAARRRSQLATFPRKDESTQPALGCHPYGPPRYRRSLETSTVWEARRLRVAVWVAGSRDVPRLPLLVHSGLFHDPLHDLASHVLRRPPLLFLPLGDFHSGRLPGPTSDPIRVPKARVKPRTRRC